MEKIFTIVEVLEDKKANITMFYLISETNIWWSTIGRIEPNSAQLWFNERKRKNLWN